MARITPNSNLPAQLPPLIGREQEIAKVSSLLKQADVRLLTLTGPGGVGKTSLALHVAMSMLNDLPGGSFFISLASISDPALVVSTIAQALGLVEVGDQSLLEILKVFLKDKRLLLLLDNFEQVITAAPLLSEILANGPHLKVLVTSREALRLRREYEFPVPPLALPDLKQLPDLQSLAQNAAVALFTQRALATKPDFALTATNARAVAEICTRLDGLPLAIELAAARIKLLGPQALLARLTSLLQVLTSGRRDFPERHQTLRTTMKWSYDLLNDEQQRLFRRLSVFVGGCTLEAVEAVCSERGDVMTPVLDAVGSLVDKSLLQQSEQAGSEPRLVMLETVREYGLECIAMRGELQKTRWAHAEYYLLLAEEAELARSGPQQTLYLERLEREHDNLRAALHFLTEDVQDREMALRLSGALWWFWSVRGYLSEGNLWLEKALAGSENVAPSVRAKALDSAGMLAYTQDNHQRAAALCRESLALFQQVGDTQGSATSLYRLGLIAWAKQDYNEAGSLAQQALALFRALGSKGDIADLLLLVAFVAINQKEYTKARLLIEESLALFREIGDKWGMAYTLLHLSRVVLSQGDATTARVLIEECLAISRELGYKGGIAYALSILGQVVLRQGEKARARSLTEESLVLRREMGDRWGIADSLFLLAKAAFSEGNYAATRSLYEESLAIARELDDKTFIAACLEGLVEVDAARSSAKDTVQLPPSHAGLTPRELAVLRLVALGLTDIQVAKKLVISPRTVNFHLTSIYSKLHVSTRSAATRYAIEHKLIEGE